MGLDQRPSSAESLDVDRLSVAAQTSADELERRLVGSAPDQAVFVGILPSARISFGSLASEAAARQRHRDNQRADFAPNAMAVRFTVPSGSRLTVAVSFAVYAGVRKDSLFNRRWAFEGVPAWGSWAPPAAVPPGDEAAPAHGAYVRLRYEQSYRIDMGPGQVLPLDLTSFAAAYGFWRNPKVQGQLVFSPLALEGNLATVELTLVNTAGVHARAPVEPTWFDVRMRVAIDAQADQSLFCPLVRDARVRFQTVNCAVTSETPSSVELGPVGRVVRYRQHNIAVSAGDRDSAPMALAELEAGLRHADALEDEIALAIQGVAVGDGAAALSRAHHAFADARGSWAWRWHQLGFVALGLRRYRQQPDVLAPLVLNVPTAGGKTEAFVGLALAIASLEPRRSAIAIVKYPTRMLSREQLARIARYLMCFERDLPDNEVRGLGYFADRDVKPDESATPTASILPECPLCQHQWSDREVRSAEGRLIWCRLGHRLKLAVRDEIFPVAPGRPPLIVVSTWDKFVSKHDKGVFTNLFGNGSFVSMVVFDEAHLIREEIGSLDSHFETAFFEAMRQGSGRYPLVVLSSATLAGIANHAHHLGLGNPTEYPSRAAARAYYRQTDEIQHVVLAAVPRGRTLLWALPMAFGEYLRVVESDAERQYLRVPMLYFPSYNTLFRAQETIKKEIGSQRINDGLAAPRLETFSRRRFELEGEGPVRQRVQSREVDAVLSTNIASVGIDLPDLNGIVFYGVPTNVSEFIQALNRVGRVSPAIAVLVLDPFKERDASYFAYLPQFIADPDSIIEWVPINRFARNAIHLTFDSIAANQLRLVFSPQFGGDNLAMADKFRKWHPSRLPDTRIIRQLKTSYRADDDPSGAYAGIVESRWTTLATNLTNNRGQGLNGYINKTPGVQDLRSLRMPGPRGMIALDAAAEALRRSGLRAMPEGYQRAEPGADTTTSRQEGTDAGDQ